MHSGDSELFAAFLYEFLTTYTNNPYNELEVFRYDDDVQFGHRECICVIQWRLYRGARGGAVPPHM